MTFERNVVSFCRESALGEFSGPASCEWRGNTWWCTMGPVKMDLKGTSFADWQALGRDADGVAADPQFVDPARDDYRLKPTSPAFACGFRAFDPARAGLLPRVPRPGTNAR